MDSTVAVDQPSKKKLVAPALGRSDTSIIKEFLGERNLFDQAEVPRTGGSIIKEFLGERNLLGQAGAPRSGGGSAGGSACASLAQKELTAASGSVEKSVASRVPREPFSDSSWLDKFLDERVSCVRPEPYKTQSSRGNPHIVHIVDCFASDWFSQTSIALV
jgi:hypothetical protein